MMIPESLAIGHGPGGDQPGTIRQCGVMSDDVRGNLSDDSGVRARVTRSHYMLRYYCRITSPCHGVIGTFLDPAIQRISSITSLNKAQAEPTQQCGCILSFMLAVPC